MNSNLPVIPTPRDVLNGRGQGVQRHPGNIKYRKLVSINKVLYNRCPSRDKMKISKGIVAAIRESGGRFLGHDEKKDVYFDIGDNEATKKTSQSLRDCHKDIRKKMRRMKAALLSSSSAELDTRRPFPDVAMPAKPDRQDMQLTADDYSQYSNLVLRALYNSDREFPAPPVAIAEAINQQPPSLPPLAPVQNNVNNGMHGVPSNAYMGPSSAAMAMALDHFPAARMPAQPMPQPNKNMPFAAMPNTTQQQPDYEELMLQQQTDGRDSSNPPFRLTNMSLGSTLSIRQLLESSEDLSAQPSSKGTIEFQSPCQLNQIDQMELNDLIPTQDEIDGFFDQNTADAFDHITDMCFTDLSNDKFNDLQETSRSSDKLASTEDTSF